MNDIDYYREQLSEYSHRAFRRHLVGGTGGNLSLRIPGTDTVLVTPTGISLEAVRPLPLATISARVVLKHVPCIECFAPGSVEL